MLAKRIPEVLASNHVLEVYSIGSKDKPLYELTTYEHGQRLAVCSNKHVAAWLAMSARIALTWQYLYNGLNECDAMMEEELDHVLDECSGDDNG